MSQLTTGIVEHRVICKMPSGKGIGYPVSSGQNSLWPNRARASEYDKGQ